MFFTLYYFRDNFIYLSSVNLTVRELTMPAYHFHSEITGMEASIYRANMQLH
ncbi:hypothetical protein NC651_017795 [Populus alba x Populus x berolinensis]|nr:hypothetical protein NC651_017795 [Populus alba x Populus x berolinensis]